MATSLGAQNSDSYAQWKTTTVLAGLCQVLMPLSDTNKHELLWEVRQLTQSDGSRARAAAILPRLQELNPEVARQFHPKFNALSDLNLRMVCSAPHNPQSAGRVPSYIAVSYCWHYPQWPLAPAATPIAPGWEISEPMMKAVMDLRQPGEGVWIDKMCINQDDQVDKAVHIGVMDAIYRCARRVAILLEDVQLERDEEDAGLLYEGFYKDLIQAVKSAGLEGDEKAKFIPTYIPSREKELRDKNMGHILAPAKAFATKVLAARWFSRGWCAHECRMNKHERDSNPLFMCYGADGRVLSFEFRFIHYMSVYLTNAVAPKRLSDLEQLNGMILSQLGWRIQSLMPERRATASAMQHIVTILPFGCLKKRDLISIALNTAGIPLYFDGEDVKTVEEVLWKFTVLVLAANDVVPLVVTGSPLRLPSGGEDNITSWAIHPSQTVLDDELRNPLPGSITATTREYIELDLLLFESLPTKASRDSQAKAAHLMEEHNLDGVADELLSALPDYTQATVRTMVDLKDSSPLHRVRHLLLSLALDNGLDWTLAFSSAMRQTISTWLYGTLGDHAHPALEPVLPSFLALFNPDPTAAPSNGNSKTSNPDCSEEAPPSPGTRTLTPDQFAALHRSLTALLDPRLLFFTTNPRRLPLSPALGTAALAPAVSSRSYVAVPAALAHLPGWHNRAWVVEPFDPATTAPSKSAEEELEDGVALLSSDDADWRAPRDDTRGTWRVRSRQVLYGCSGGVWGEEGTEVIQSGGGGLLGDGKGLVLLRRQRVYGAEDYQWGRISRALKGSSGNDAVAKEAAEVAN